MQGLQTTHIGCLVLNIVEALVCKAVELVNLGLRFEK